MVTYTNHASQEAGLTQWWEHLPSTNVAWVSISWLAVISVDWVWWFSSQFLEVFPWVIQFSPFTENQHIGFIWFDLLLFSLICLSLRLVGHVCPAMRNETLIKLLLLLSNWPLFGEKKRIWIMNRVNSLNIDHHKRLLSWSLECAHFMIG